MRNATYDKKVTKLRKKRKLPFPPYRHKLQPGIWFVLSICVWLRFSSRGPELCVGDRNRLFPGSEVAEKKIKHFQFKLKKKKKKESENGSSQQEAEVSSKKNIFKQ